MHTASDTSPEPAAPPANERFIGCLLGMAIGDALGLPAAGLTRAEIDARYGVIRGYEPRLAPDGSVSVPPGQVSANTELALCLVEGLASSGGYVDPLAVGGRCVRLLHGPHAELLGATTRAALERAEESGDYQHGLGGDGTAGVGPAARVAPVALVHALGRFNAELLTRETLRASLITHASPEAINGALAIAYAVDRLARREIPPAMLLSEVLAFIDEDAVARQTRVAERLLTARRGPEDDATALATLGTSGYVAEAVPAALYVAAAYGDDFVGAVTAAANAGGATDAMGALVGALLGVWAGARALPEALVEGLESRMYVLMAAPALFRVAQRRAGLFLQLHQRP